MNNIIRIVLLSCVALICASCQEEQVSRAEKPEPVSHTFLCADYGGNMVRIVSAEGDIVWEHPADRPQDVWQLPNGNIMFTQVRSVAEVTRDKQIANGYRTDPPDEIHSCQPLPGGGYMVAVSGPCKIVEVSDSKVKTVKLVTNQLKPHNQMRIARKLANGNYLVAHNMDRVVREYDPKGMVVRSIKVPGNPYAAVRLANGNTLISCGDGHKLIEVDAKDNIVWEINENDIPGNPLRFVAGVQRLPNGNTIVCNWGGHGHIGEQPQIFEVTRDKKLVWQFSDWENFSTITSIQLLDEKADVTKGQVLR